LIRIRLLLISLYKSLDCKILLTWWTSIIRLLSCWWLYLRHLSWLLTWHLIELLLITSILRKTSRWLLLRWWLLESTHLRDHLILFNVSTHLIVHYATIQFNLFIILTSDTAYLEYLQVLYRISFLNGSCWKVHCKH